MKIAIAYTVFVLVIWLLGMALDVSGLYFSVRFASKNKIKLSKFGYFIMRFGEILERIADESMIAIPLLFIWAILKVI